MEICHTKQLLY